MYGVGGILCLAAIVLWIASCCCCCKERRDHNNNQIHTQTIVVPSHNPPPTYESPNPYPQEFVVAPPAYNFGVPNSSYPIASPSAPPNWNDEDLKKPQQNY
eukprot:TRINITY_DN20142_c0_g1_i1.p1 TRINITY_DN20142_c0_g1~~TRINITY_DN20142_c0_g1_i1.p1  ORF type:complete len:101 (+),score=4.00 TRINITY_DN20142_c0_g1_i1:33-335(+)